MTFSLTWLPSVLKSAGLKVEEYPGWQTRGHGDVGTIKGVLCHHNADANSTEAHDHQHDVDLIANGRPDLAGPLSQLFLANDGTFTVIAAGSGWHAGAGNWQGVTTGNHSLIGIEADNSGLGNEPWPEVEMDAYARGCGAILKHIGAPVIMCAGHKEYALPRGRKSDPNFDMNKFRQRVADFMGGDVAPNIPETTSALPLPVVGTGKFRVKGVSPEMLALRFLPNGDKRGDLPENTIVNELARDGSWIQVRTPAGYVGWVAGRFLEAA